jgi:hypothetical protein
MVHPHFAVVKEHVLDIFEGMYGEDATEATLRVDPSDRDVDPGPFYETLSQLFNVPFDEDLEQFGGFGGTLKQTIEFIASRWDGKTLVELEAVNDGGMDD